MNMQKKITTHFTKLCKENGLELIIDHRFNNCGTWRLMEDMVIFQTIYFDFQNRYATFREHKGKDNGSGRTFFYDTKMPQLLSYLTAKVKEGKSHQ